LALVAFLAIGVAQDTKPAEKKPKDQAEYDLITSITKDPDAANRLKTLEKWSKDYPQTDYASERQKFFLVTYQQLNKTKEAFNVSVEMLKTDPNDVLALTTIVSYIYAFNPPSAADLDTAEKTSNYILTNLDAIYAPDKKPADKTPEAWAQLKPQMKVYAQRTIAWIYLTRKDNERAETELLKTLEMDPNQGQVSQWLGGAILAQNKTKPEKQPLALYHYARAAAYDGPGSLPAAGRAQIQTFLTRAYKSYHGSEEGLDQLLATAKTNALPPADFKIPSTAEIADAKLKAQQAIDAADPMMALWRTIRTELTGDNGPAYFESSVKDAGLPGGVNGVTKFKGKLVSMTPALRPKELVLAVEKPGVPDVTLKFEAPLAGKMEPGGEIEFEGTAKEFKKDPYMLVFEVEKAKVAGWTGKNTPAPAKPVSKKKAQ